MPTTLLNTLAARFTRPHAEGVHLLDPPHDEPDSWGEQTTVGGMLLGTLLFGPQDDAWPFEDEDEDEGPDWEGAAAEHVRVQKLFSDYLPLYFDALYTLTAPSGDVIRVWWREGLAQAALACMDA